MTPLEADQSEARMNRAISLALVGGVAVFAAFWAYLGDPVGAFLSLLVVALASALAIAVIGYFLTNLSNWSRSIRGVRWEDHLEQLEKDGKAIRERCETTRCISIEDFSNSCLAHLIDVGNSRVLCLYGQSYFDFQPIDDDPDVNQPRLFPTKDFLLVRRKSNGEVLALIPGADVFEPVVSGSIAGIEQVLSIRLRDGDIIQNHSFERLELACKNAIMET